MKVIIMAAGVGSRLSNISNGKPKCLIKAGGETLIKRIVRIFKSRGIDDVSVITGYKKELIHQELGQEVDFIYNPFYPITNSIASLWLTKDKLDGDVILMNADLFFEPKLLDAVLRQRNAVVMMSDSTRIETADYRFCFQGNRITHYGKHLSDSETDGEYVGMARLDSSFMRQFLDRLEEMIGQGRTNCWWEEVLYSFIPQGVPIYHHDVAGTFWTEIDDPKDYNRLQTWLRGGISVPTTIPA